MNEQPRASFTNHSPAFAGGSPASGERLAATRNRRTHPRAPHRLPCCVRVFDSEQNTWVAKLGHTVNLSSSGLAVQIGMAMPVGARVEAVLPRFEDDPLSISGHVMHSRRVMTGTFEVGIQTAHTAPVAP